jgi:hypothetical protein
MLPQPLNSSAISNSKLVDTWAKLKVYDLIDVILLEGAIRNVQLREIGTIGYRWHMTKTSKHKSTTQHRKLKKWTTQASPKSGALEEKAVAGWWRFTEFDTHIYPSHVPMWRIKATTGCHLSWSWYLYAFCI